MANHKSALKRLRQNAKRKVRNNAQRSACRTAIKKTHAAIKEGSLEQAKELFLKAESIIAKAANKGLYHKNNASRKISRLHRMLLKAKQA